MLTLNRMMLDLLIFAEIDGGWGRILLDWRVDLSYFHQLFMCGVFLFSAEIVTLPCSLMA